MTVPHPPVTHGILECMVLSCLTEKSPDVCIAVRDGRDVPEQGIQSEILNHYYGVENVTLAEKIMHAADRTRLLGVDAPD